MNRKQLIFALALVWPAMNATAEMTSEEKTGAASGLVIGAVVGGPIGAGVGALIGGGIFGQMISLARANKQLKNHMNGSSIDLRDVDLTGKGQITMLNQALEHLAERQVKELQLSIQFRTASSKVENFYDRQLELIADLLNRNPGALVTLTGHADRRGANDYNQSLSQARADKVKSKLMQFGVNSSQLKDAAYGESQSLGIRGGVEGYFFDRRVLVDITVDNSDILAPVGISEQ